MRLARGILKFPEPKAARPSSRMISLPGRFATTRSNWPGTWAGGVRPNRQRSAAPLRSAFSLASVTAFASMSTPSTSSAPSRAQAMLRRPLPQPTSSTRRGRGAPSA
jgi:hypothetical protein